MPQITSTVPAATDVQTLEYREGAWSAPFPPCDSERTLVLVFGAPSYSENTGPLDQIREAYPTSHLAGCSTSGEILDTSLHDESIALAVVRFNHTRLATVAAPVQSPQDSFAAGQEIARRLEQPSLRAVLVFSDGLRVNGSELVRGLNSILPPSVVITGGLAGDGSRFQNTWVLRAGRPTGGFVTAVGLYGDRLRVGHGSKGGWDVFGPERLVTRSVGNVLYELDGRPALPLYKDYLGELAAGLPATALLFPLALRNGPTDEKRLVRTILAVDDAGGSMTFAGDIPQGYLAQLMRANFDRLIEGAAESALMTTRTGGGHRPCLALAVSCVGRRLVLGERTEEELERTAEILPVGSKQIGFYSYGEISPYSTGRCDLHNQTMTITTIAEE